MTEVVLNITPGDLQTELVHIHEGPCDDLGGVVHGLTSFVGGSGGSAKLVDASLASLRSGDFAINSHEAGNAGNYTTCGDIPAGETEAVLIALIRTERLGQSHRQGRPDRRGAEPFDRRPGDTGGAYPYWLGVVYRLTSFVDGSGFSVTAVDATLASLKTGGFAINSHEADNDGNYTSCVDIPDEDDTVTFALDEQNDSGHSGWATLTARDRMTEIVLHLAPGDLGTELVHIHNGQCGDDLGGVLGGLTSFVNGSGASVTTANATLASLQSGGFAINSHEAGNPGTYTACGNIPASAEGIAAIKAAAAGAGLSSTGDTNLLPVALTALALGFVFFAGGTVLLRRRGSRLA